MTLLSLVLRLRSGFVGGSRHFAGADRRCAPQFSFGTSLAAKIPLSRFSTRRPRRSFSLAVTYLRRHSNAPCPAGPPDHRRCTAFGAALPDRSRLVLVVEGFAAALRRWSQ